MVIATLTGNNGILTNANKANKKQVESTVTENANLAVQAAKLEAEEKSTKGNYLAQSNMKSTSETIGQELNGNKDLISTSNKYQIVYTSNASNATETITVTYGKATENNTSNDASKISGGNSDYANACNYDNAVIKITIKVTGNTIEIETITGSARREGTETPTTETLYGTTSGGDSSTIGIATVGTLATSLSTIDGKAYSSSNPPIPKGYAPLDYGNAVWANASTTYNNGLVISDSTTADTGNEWVWIPVSDATTMYTTGEATLDGTTVKTSKYSKSEIISGMTRKTPGDTTGYREPDVLSDSYYDGSTEYQTTLGLGDLTGITTTFVNEYNTMIESITKYGGFYIGRYELSSGGVKKNQETLTNKTWYELYNSCKTVAKAGSNTTSRMIYGCQWDVTCNWIANYGDKKNITDSTSWGNHKNNTDTGHGTKQNTGYSESWKANNIYDFAGNVVEWTQEAYTTEHRAQRGVNYNVNGYSYPVYYRAFDGPDFISDYDGSRPTLILQP